MPFLLPAGQGGTAHRARHRAPRAASTCCRGRWRCWARSCAALPRPLFDRVVRGPQAQAAASLNAHRSLPTRRGDRSLAHGPSRPRLRIACLVPSLTELLFALGLGPQVVARTGFCVHPREARRVPKIGGTKDPDLARLRALAPTHLVVNVDENRREDVEAARAFVPNVIVTHPHGARGQRCACSRCSATSSTARARPPASRRDFAGGARKPSRTRRTARCRASRCSTSSGASRG